jgi:hypothetical protein
MCLYAHLLLGEYRRLRARAAREAVRRLGKWIELIRAWLFCGGVDQTEHACERNKYV